MKIKTQFYLLIVGILIVPILLLLGSGAYFQYLRSQEQADIAVYEDVAAMLDAEMHFEDREALSRILKGVSKMGSLTVFRKDFLVLHSTIPEFSAGAHGSPEAVLALLERGDPQYSYSFESPGWMYHQGYMLIRRDISRFGNFRPWFSPFPGLILLCIFFFPVIFAIVMSLAIARSITKSVLVLERATRRIAEGELDFAVDVKGSNEITSLTHSLNKMRNELKEEELRRSRFIMGITHDLKTPLALIKAYTEAIEDGITEDPATHKGATEIISAKADQLEGMINDLLEYVRMDSGEWRSQLQNVDITAFLRNTAKAFAPDVELLRHEFRSGIALPSPLFVPLDERLLLRALENLVNNAVRYTPDGSVISLGARLVENTLRLTVSDNGPGIDSGDLPHVFEMFYRGTASRREQGMGMGLAVVKWVVDSHGWSIMVNPDTKYPLDQDQKTETCFCITIPLPEQTRRQK